MTVTTIRPNGQQFISGTINLTGGASTNAVTSDNSDSSFMRGAAAGVYVALAMGDVTLSAGQRVKSCQIRARAAAQVASGHYETLTLKMMSAADATIPASGTWTLSRTNTTIVTSSGPIAYAGPGGKAWDQASVNALRLNAQWNIGSNGVAEFAGVYELYVDVDVNSQPSAGTVTVTGFTNNAVPNVAWVYADTDGDVQSRFRVKVFNSTTYGAGNFNADTSPADFDSAEQLGVADNYTLTKPLLNGVTYKAYVRVGQDWPGPQGRTWWSDWAASTAFTVTFTPPPTPVIQSATVLADSNQYRAVVNVLVPYNLLAYANSSFEGPSLGNWAALANCAVVGDAAQFSDGAASMKMTSTAAGDMTARCALDLIGDPKVDGGQTYTALASFHANTSTRSCQVGLEWIDSTGATISTQFGSSVTDSAGAGVWTQAVFTAAAPTNARQARVQVKVLATGAAAEIHWVDKVDVHAGTSTTWTLGGLINDQGDLLIERGEYLDDARGSAENWLHPQVASAGTVLQNQGYGFAIDTTKGTLNWKWLDKVIPAVGETPAGMLDWNPGTATTPSIEFGNWFYGGTAYMPPVLPSQAHTFSVWAWVNTGTFVAQPRIDWRDGTGGFISSSTGGNVTLTTTPQRVTVTGTAPSNALLASGAVLNVNSDDGKHVYFTRVGFGPGAVPVDGRKAKGVPTGVSASGTPAGLNWVKIRPSTNTGLVLPPGFAYGSVETYPDYEYVPARPVLYRASIAYSFGSNVLRSPYSTQAMVYAAPPTQTLLRSVADPTLQLVVGLNEQASYSISDDAAVYHPLGADGAPIRVRDWVGGEDGQLVLAVMTEAQFARLQALLRTNDVLQVQWKEGGRTYLLVTDRSYDEYRRADLPLPDVDGNPSTLHHTLVTLSYIETAAP